MILAVSCARHSCLRDLDQAESSAFPVALANNTPIRIGSSVLRVGDTAQGEARRHPRLLMPTTPSTAASYSGILVSPSASPQLERDLGHFPTRVHRARSHDSTCHPEPSSPEARSKTRLDAADGRTGGKWCVHCHKPDQSVNTLSTDRIVAAVSEGERAMGPSTLTLPFKEKGGGPHNPTGTISDALTDPRCEGDAPAASRTSLHCDPKAHAIPLLYRQSPKRRRLAAPYLRLNPLSARALHTPTPRRLQAPHLHYLYLRAPSTASPPSRAVVALASASQWHPIRRRHSR